MERTGGRCAGLASAVLVFLLLAGCSSSPRPLQKKRVLVRPGMTSQEVRSRIGAPSRIVPLDPVPGIREQTVEIWSYTYTAGPSFGEAVLSVVAGALVLAAVVGAGGNIPTGGGGGGGTRYRFNIGFGPDGRVRGVTDLERLN